MNPSEVQDCLELLGRLWPAWRPNADILRLWGRVLAPWKREDAIAAIEQHKVTQRYNTTEPILGDVDGRPPERLQTPVEERCATAHGMGDMGEIRRLCRFYRRPDLLAQYGLAEETP